MSARPGMSPEVSPMLIDFVDGPLRGCRAPAAVFHGKMPRFLVAHLVRDLPGLLSVDEYEFVPATGAEETPAKARWIRFVRYESASSPTTVPVVDIDQGQAHPPARAKPPGARGNGTHLRV